MDEVIFAFNVFDLDSFSAQLLYFISFERVSWNPTSNDRGWSWFHGNVMYPAQSYPPKK